MSDPFGTPCNTFYPESGTGTDSNQGALPSHAGLFDLNNSRSQAALNSPLLCNPQNIDIASLPLLDDSSFDNIIYPTPPNNTPTNTLLGSLDNTRFAEGIAHNLPGVGVSTAEYFRTRDCLLIMNMSITLQYPGEQ